MPRLPVILAGPIVRRATPDEVNVWLATSVPLPDPELRLFDAQSMVPITTEPTFRSVRLGLQLFVHLLTARPVRDLLPQGDPIAYDISGSGQRQGGLAAMTNLRTLVLPGFKLPTLVLQVLDIGHLHAIYGSCRKIHGPRPDMMKAAEQILVTAPDGRPEVLFLGGDQIYADDVDGALLPHISSLAVDLIGYPEFISGLPPQAHLPSADRGKHLKKAFTSGEMKHHLLTFGEYAATYLFAWNPELWRRTAITGPAAIPAGDAAFAAKAARTVLANVVTYMIFDDHEITDDWFLNAAWREHALEVDWAKRIIVNGLCAFWAFQGWGNNPGNFDDRFLRTMQDFGQHGNRASDASALLIDHGRWSFLAPTSPPTLVLDTRTGRSASKAFADRGPPSVDRAMSPSYLKYGYETGPRSTTRDTDAPRLLGTRERLRLGKLLADADSPIAPLIVIAPAPILGFRPIEEVQEAVGSVSAAAGDLESWAANPRNLVDFVELLLRHGVDFAVVLSGDVHYAFEISATVSTGHSTVRIAQFCSSALKNRPHGGQKRGAQFLRLTGALTRALAWWSFGKDDDGAITRFPAEAGNRFSDLVRHHGSPSFVVKEQLNERDGIRVLLTNNVGEIMVDDAGVRHRFWRPDHVVGRPEDTARMKPDEFLDWRVAAWPTPRVWL